MKKKIGSSKSMKKYAMGGQESSGPGDDQLPVTAGYMKKTKTKERSADGDYLKKTVTRETPGGNISTETKTRRTVQGFIHGAPRIDKFKKGGSVGKSSKTSAKKKFAALAPPYNKATAADRIAGAKGAKPKMKMGGSMKSKKC